MRQPARTLDFALLASHVMPCFARLSIADSGHCLIDSPCSVVMGIPLPRSFILRGDCEPRVSGYQLANMAVRAPSHASFLRGLRYETIGLAD